MRGPGVLARFVVAFCLLRNAFAQEIHFSPEERLVAIDAALIRRQALDRLGVLRPHRLHRARRAERCRAPRRPDTRMTTRYLIIGLDWLLC